MSSRCDSCHEDILRISSQGDRSTAETEWVVGHEARVCCAGARKKG